ncbi:MAG: amino acid adenylation domain-containing protein, partial [bacterium]|nr:amino acid adenylation domain-containing protein [bacterium]
SIETVGEEPRQLIHNHVPFEIQSVTGPLETAVKGFVKPFDLTAAPLLRVALVETGQTRILAVDMHHIICDPISHEVLAGEFQALCADRELPQLELQYRDYTQWQNSDVQQARFEQQKKYWTGIFSDDIPVLDLMTDFSRPQVQSFEGASMNFMMEDDLIQAFKRLGASNDVTLFMLILAVFSVLLAKLSGQEDIIVGTPISSRQHEDIEHMIGMFVNTLALRNFPAGHKTFNEFLGEFKNTTLEAYRNADYPFEELIEQISLNRDVSRNPLFDVMFNYLKQSDFSGEASEIMKNTLNQHRERTSKFDISLTALEFNDKVLFNFEYCTRLFKAETIDRIVAYFKRLVTAVVEAPNRNISGINILSPEETHRILYQFNDTAAAYPVDKTIHRLFEDQVEKTPNTVALTGPSLFGDGDGTIDDGTIEVNYSKLDEESGYLAQHFHREGVTTDSIVAVKLERSVQMITTLVGILKAGGGYLPIEPDYPEDRINYMLEDSDAAMLITRDNLPRLLQPPASSSPIPDVPVDGLAYVIYTSGTTGKPKGALIQHRNLVRLMFHKDYLFDFGHRDVWTMFHSYCFDFSVWEMYGALLYGGRLVIIPKMTGRDPERCLDILEKEKVTVLNQTPPAFYNLSQLEMQRPGARLNLKYVIFGGDTLNPGQLKPWKQKYPQTRLINMFGITETTVHVTFKEIQTDDIQLNISNIGRPIPTLSTYVMDRNQKLVPPGVSGELCVGGLGVCRGYLNRPQLTAEKFIENPYLSGEMLYRSGDLGRYRENGDLEYLGRIDFQVKIRGFRIELGEIETHLLRHDVVTEAVMQARTDKSGNRFLCAYIVTGGEVDPAGLKEFLAQHVPDYMIPSYFVFMDAIPLTANGKIHRGALPLPDIGNKGEIISPCNKIEEKLLEIWAGVLDRDKKKISVHDDFFQIGGHSLNAAILASRVRKQLEIDLPLIQVFITPTISGLANYVKSAGKSEFISIEPVELKEYYPLTSVQKRLCFLQTMDTSGTAYNVPGTIVMATPMSKEELETIFNIIIQRHEILRTSIENVGEEPRQRVHEHVLFELECLDESMVPDCGDGKNQDTESLVKHFVRPFDLKVAPLLRAGFINMEKKQVLAVDMHHIV